MWPVSLVRVLTSAVTPSSRVRAFVALTKPRIIELLLVTTVPVMVLANDGIPSLWLILWTVVGGTLSAGGANAINMYIDRDIDSVMNRTRNRPLVTGEVAPTEALIFAVAIEAFAVVLLWVAVNPLSAMLALGACLFYVFVYTLWLKRRSTQNIVIGGAAGAAPALIGWSAVTDSLSIEAWLLFAIVFFWTPPHFWALAIRYEGDYASVDVPMMPVVDGDRHTADRILGYSVVVVALTVVLWWQSELRWIYLGTALVAGVLFVAGAVELRRKIDASDAPSRAMRYFAYSITYLTAVFSAVAIDPLVF